MLSGDFLRADWLGVRPVSRIVGTCSRAKNNDQQHARQHHGAGEGEKGTVDRVPRGIYIEFQQPQPGLQRFATTRSNCGAMLRQGPHPRRSGSTGMLFARMWRSNSARSPRSDGAGARGGLLFGLVGWQVALVYLVFGLVNRSPTAPIPYGQRDGGRGKGICDRSTADGPAAVGHPLGPSDLHPLQPSSIP